MAEALGLDELQAITRMSIGDARIELGDLHGLADFEAGIEAAVALSSPEAITGYVNLADTVMDLGELSRAIELRELAKAASERFGDARSLRWLRAERCGELYWTGRWDDAASLADDFIRESEAGDRHYMEAYCRVVRGRIRLARGNGDGAIDDAVRALEFGRQARDPQALYPPLAFLARAVLAAGRAREATDAADELLGLVHASEKTPVAYLWILRSRNRARRSWSGRRSSGRDRERTEADSLAPGRKGACDRGATRGSDHPCRDRCEAGRGARTPSRIGRSPSGRPDG